MAERDGAALTHLAAYSRELVDMVRGRRRADLDSDRMLALSVVRLLEIIGEAARRVSEGARSRHPQIPWAQLIGLRNRLIHGYDAIDLDIIWRIVESDVPALLAEMDRLASCSDKDA